MKRLWKISGCNTCHKKCDEIVIFSVLFVQLLFTPPPPFWYIHFGELRLPRKRCTEQPVEFSFVWMSGFSPLDDFHLRTFTPTDFSQSPLCWSSPPLCPHELLPSWFRHLLDGRGGRDFAVKAGVSVSNHAKQRQQYIHIWHRHLTCVHNIHTWIPYLWTAWPACSQHFVALRCPQWSSWITGSP